MDTEPTPTQQAPASASPATMAPGQRTSGEPSPILDLPVDRVDLRDHLEGLSKAHENDFRASSIAGRLMLHSRGGRVLDAGCGSGLLSLRLHRAGCDVVSVDAEEAMVGFTRQTLKGGGFEDAVVKEMTLERLDSLEGGKFDEIYCCDVIEHIQDDLLAMQQLRSMLKPGGQLILTVPAWPFLYGERDRRMGHYRRYTRKALKKVFVDAGFDIQSVRWWNLSGFLLNAIGSKLKKKGFSEGFRYGKRSALNRAGHWFLNRWFHGFENHVPVPAGLTLIVVANRDAPRAGS
jgi:SAM-dependent methyltransferase